MTSLGDVHRALADQLRARVQRDINVSPWPFSGMTFPRIEIHPGDNYLDYFAEDLSDDGLCRVQLLLVIDIDTIDPETALIVVTDLLSWEGTSSIRAAVAWDRTLGGVVDSAMAMTATWRTDENGLTATVPVEILAQKA